MKIRNRNGFTIVELMIALLIGGIVMGSLGTLYVSYQRQQTLQEEVTEMQQEVRVALEIATREIRHAGHDTTAANTAGAGFVVASPVRLQFTMDLSDGAGGDPDGDVADPNEDVTYSFSAADDADDNGIADLGVGGVADFGRNTGGGLQALSSNIHAIAFAYAYDSNNDGMLELNAISNEVIWAVPDGGGNWIDLDTDSSGVIDAVDGQVVMLPNMLADATQLQEIRAVKVWILARTSRNDPAYTDNVSYKVGPNLINPNDNFRRRLMTVDIRCRNMGLQ